VFKLFCVCAGSLGFVRRRFYEPVRKGVFGPEQKGIQRYFSPSYYVCDFVVPQAVLDNDPHKASVQSPNYYLLFNATESMKLTGNFTIAVFDEPGKQKSVQKPVGQALHQHNRTSLFSRWCLAFR